MRSEPCACGMVLRWPVDEHAWPWLMRAHVCSERHQIWRVRTGTVPPHIYEEHLPAVLPPVRRVA